MAPVNPKKLPKGILKPILLLWIVLTLLTAIFIPQYDFGFDGVKIWLLLSAIIFLILQAVALLFKRKA